MNRETQTIITPSQKELVIKTYLTARERNELRSVYLGGMKLDTSLGEASVKELDNSLIEKSENKLMELAIVSYDGSSENTINRLLDGKVEEYDFVIGEITKLNSSLTVAK